MKIENRKARHDYFVEDIINTGIVLVGTEVKSIRNGSANIAEAFCRIKNGELFIHNMYIAHYEHGNIFNHDERRVRKLLVNKREIKKLEDAVAIKGYSLIPLRVFFSHGYAKLAVGICKGKKNYDKRNTIKERDIKRNLEKELKNKY
ncbi:MAG: SsrA-binding protein SmpB [Bacilli bacterium]